MEEVLVWGGRRNTLWVEEGRNVWVSIPGDSAEYILLH